MKTALVLSAGGMFGAWQAGAWKVLAEHYRPDLIVGASIGSLNGWAIAGGCPPGELVRYWLELSVAGKLRVRWPRSLLHGVIDTRGLEQTIRDLHRNYRPKCDYALVATDLLKLKPRIFRGAGVTAEHLLASCAVPLLFDQRRLDGRVYSDGGLLAALPIWAAAELGADHMLALQALPPLQAPVIRAAHRAMHRLSSFRPSARVDERVTYLEPSAPLGGLREMMVWRRDRISSWIARGQQDAAALTAQKSISIGQCFESK
jgi:NTE family protein